MEPHLYEELDRLQETHWWFLGRRAVIGAVLERRLPRREQRRILDVGCGTGGMLALLSRFGHVEGLEGSDAALALCQARFGDSIRLVKGQIPQDVPQDHAYDLVTLFDVLEHLGSPVAGLSAIRGALKPDGRLVITVPAFQFLWSAHDELHHHFRRYTRSLLVQQLQAAGFEVEWSSYFNALLFPPIAAVRLLQKVRSSRPASDLEPTPGLLGRILEQIFAAERHLVPRLPLPAGVSLVAIAVPTPAPPG
jgi:SAM-dependent methyltransferase